MMKAFCLAIVVLSIATACQAVSVAKCSRNDTSYEVIAETKLGKIRGNCDHVFGESRSDKRGANIYSWLGIPYAKPPVNERRFKPPEPAEPWEDTLDARHVPNSCMQTISPDTGYATGIFRLNNDSSSLPSEDCLYLNVFSPADAFLKTDMNNLNYKAPVMVFFPGVGYTKGSSLLDIYDPSVFSALSGIVVVTFNYRLGVFGFLHLNDSETNETIEGNQALLDQHMALKWVSENIEAFGGDPSKITVAGQGVGGVLASFHLFYKPSWPLYRNMILQSASPLNPVFTPISSDEASRRTKAMLGLFKCTNLTALKCAQSLDANQLLNASTHLFNNMMLKGNRDASSYLRSAFKPVIDGRFFKSSPKDLLYTSQYKFCNILTGFTSNEGSIQLPRTSVCSKTEEVCRQNMYTTEMIDFLSKYYEFYPDWPGKNKTPISNILSEYTGMSVEVHKNPKIVKRGLTDIIESIVGEELVVCPVKKFSEIVSRKNKVYVYQYDHKISTSLWPSWFGAVHGDDLAMTFAHTLAIPPFTSFNVSRNPWLPNSSSTYSEDEKALSKELMGLWITFIRTDNPNAANRYRAKNSEKTWPEYAQPQPANMSRSFRKNNLASREQSILVLKTNGTKINRFYHSDDCDVWQTISRDFGNQYSRNYSKNKSTTSATTTSTTTTPPASTTTSGTTSRRNKIELSTASKTSQPKTFKTELKPVFSSLATSTKTTLLISPTKEKETVQTNSQETESTQVTDDDLN